MVRVELYWLLVICTPACRPSSLALPMLVRSRKAIRYSKHSQGISFRSSLSSSFLSCRRQQHPVSWQGLPRETNGIDVQYAPSRHHSNARPGPVAAGAVPAPRSRRARRRFSSRHRKGSGRCRCRRRGGWSSSRSVEGSVPPTAITTGMRRGGDRKAEERKRGGEEEEEEKKAGSGSDGSQFPSLRPSRVLLVLYWFFEWD